MPLSFIVFKPDPKERLVCELCLEPIGPEQVIAEGTTRAARVCQGCLVAIREGEDQFDSDERIANLYLNGYAEQVRP